MLPNKIICLLITLLFSVTVNSQNSASEKDSLMQKKFDSMAVIKYPDIMYKDYGLPFIKWKERPQSFKIMVFNRWGETYDFSFNPDYILDADNFEKKIPEGTLLVYWIEIIRPSGEKLRYRGKVTYMGYYRCG